MSKQTKEQIANHYSCQKKLKPKVFGNNELVCTYETKTLKKAVFFTETLDNTTFRRFIKIMNELGATKIVVHCDFAYMHCDNLEVILNKK